MESKKEIEGDKSDAKDSNLKDQGKSRKIKKANVFVIPEERNDVADAETNKDGKLEVEDSHLEVDTERQRKNKISSDDSRSNKRIHTDNNELRRRRKEFIVKGNYILTAEYLSIMEIPNLVITLRV